MKLVKSQRIAKLNGFDNYDVWAQNMTNLLKYDSLWSITSDKELELKIPSSSGKFTEGENIPTTVSPAADREYQMMLKRRRKKINKWNRSNDKTCLLIMLTAKAEPRVHIQKLNNVKIM